MRRWRSTGGSGGSGLQSVRWVRAFGVFAERRSAVGQTSNVFLSGCRNSLCQTLAIKLLRKKLSVCELVAMNLVEQTGFTWTRNPPCGRHRASHHRLPMRAPLVGKPSRLIITCGRWMERCYHSRHPRINLCVTYGAGTKIPPAIARLGWRYHHLGLPHGSPRRGERHVQQLGIHVCGFETSPYGNRVDALRPAVSCGGGCEDSSAPGVCRRRSGCRARRQGNPDSAELSAPGVRVAFILDDGVPIELLELEPRDRD
jgi:hypothetical protein